ncbi:HNH endonuclease [Brevibacillus laterosporus]|uniref:HNH endonuclease n=1 Tax=Brevibacillus laterosporus TaxID=1465 RepID=A0A518V7R2_BRELA|nr:HNH endonuclease [Brevibacillus laterosporus]
MKLIHLKIDKHADKHKRLIPTCNFEEETPDPNEWQIDHIIPRDKDGTNSFSNAQVLTRKENRDKSNKLPSDLNKPSKKTPPTKPKRRKK